MLSVFQVLKVVYLHPRRYPRFEVMTFSLLLASSLDKAEEFLRKYVAAAPNVEDVYVFLIREMPVDIPTLGEECLSERAYDPAGHLIERPVFLQGDIVDFLDDREVRLSFVGRADDDGYLVFNGPRFSHHQSIEANRVFAPRFKVPATQQRSIEKASRICLSRIRRDEEWHRLH